MREHKRIANLISILKKNIFFCFHRLPLAFFFIGLLFGTSKLIAKLLPFLRDVFSSSSLFWAIKECEKCKCSRLIQSKCLTKMQTTESDFCKQINACFTVALYCEWCASRLQCVDISVISMSRRELVGRSATVCCIRVHRFIFISVSSAHYYITIVPVTFDTIGEISKHSSSHQPLKYVRKGKISVKESNQSTYKNLKGKMWIDKKHDNCFVETNTNFD